jgi:gamma-glutamylcyclotransferase (GGCT)/AIG2-like uncharacterized protein YtfP
MVVTAHLRKIYYDKDKENESMQSIENVMKPRLYIAYGSNLNLEQMKRRCPTARPVGTAEIQGYDLLFRGSHRSGIATIEPGTDSVPVLLWSVRPRDEQALDVYEGWPSLYRKEMMSVELNGKAVDAMVYIMNGNEPLTLPSDYYYETILQGYTSAGFDTGALNRALERSELAQSVEQEHDIDFNCWG